MKLPLMGFSVKTSEPLSGDGSYRMRQGQCYHNGQLTIKQLCIPSEAGRDVKYYISQVTIFSLARRLRRFGSNWRLTESIAPSRRSKLESC
ncbi:hypothetical protein HBH48_073980 [Parastagonospora nodorum]|nr:hypothetical protein HBH48_073980 [Parastagonospora nodorum]